jgi:hypothetical protein
MENLTLLRQRQAMYDAALEMSKEETTIFTDAFVPGRAAEPGFLQATGGWLALCERPVGLLAASSPDRAATASRAGGAW